MSMLGDIIMKINRIPFSYYGSYLSIVEENNELYIRSLHGKSKKCMNSMKIIPLYKNKKCNYTIEASFNEIILHFPDGVGKICFIDEKRLLVKAFHPEISFLIDTLPVYNYEYNYYLQNDTTSYCIINSYKNLTKYLVYPQQGNISLEQDIHISNIGSTDTSNNTSTISLQQNEDEELSFIIEDIATNTNIPSTNYFDYEICASNALLNFMAFYDAFHIQEEKYIEKAKEAAYVLWSNTVAPQANLKRYGIYASSHHFPGIWSWDNAFASLALSGHHDELAFANMEVVFDHQDELGQIPGSLSDSTIRWNFSKPPVHGYFFLKMMEHQHFNETQLKKIYDWIVKLTNFYFTYKDSNQDGICEYQHGNDSGQDNSSVFADLVVVDSPDLTAFLIKNLDCLSKIAKLLNREEECLLYQQKADALTTKFLAHFIQDDLPIAMHTYTKKQVGHKALLPYISLILEDRLPKNIQKAMVAKIKDEYITQWGIATEQVNSEFYCSDAYWRGPIWAPSSLLIIEALKACNENDLANSLIDKFKTLINQSSFYENFDAISGVGLRDCSFSWTAATFLYYLNK